MLPREARVKAKRRVDYRPPAFLVDDVALEFDLDPDATGVTATYAFRRNPAAATPTGTRRSCSTASSRADCASRSTARRSRADRIVRRRVDADDPRRAGRAGR